MQKLQRNYLKTEGSLDGMCYDACLEMKRQFPRLRWYAGWVILPISENFRGREWHNWMETASGKRYDPTRQQFAKILKYERVKTNC